MWQEWQQAPLLNTPSRSQPSGGRWKTAVIPLPLGCEGCEMEFVIKSSFGQVCHLCRLISFLQQYTSLLHHIQAASCMRAWYHNLAANITSILLSTKFSVVHVTFAKSVFSASSCLHTCTHAGATCLHLWRAACLLAPFWHSTCVTHLYWAAWYITRLLVKLTPKGVVFSFLTHL